MHALNQQVSEALDSRRAELAAQIVEREFVRHPELEQRDGKTARAKMLEDTGHHLAYLAQAIAADSSGLFGDYIGWAKILLAKHGVPGSYLGTLLESTKESLRQELAPELSRLAGDYLDAGLQQLPRLPVEVPGFIADGTPLASLAREYLQALLQGDRPIASKLILDAAEHGTPVRDIYLQVFQRTQYEVGRLWQVNEISVAQEHYCTAATQFIMTQLYPYVFAAEKTRGTLVATSVSGDLHEIGVRMVCDFFEMEGWRTHYLGANVPAPNVIQAVVQNQATVLAISATISYHVRAVETLIAAARRTPACDGLKILVGGYPFNIAPDLWKKIGADGSASDAQGAINLANQFTNPSTAGTDPGEVSPAVAPPCEPVAPPPACGQPAAAAKKPAPSARSLDRRDDHFLGELTRTNSELINLQRAMARKNADLAAAQKNLGASEQRYRSLSECSPIGILEMDAAGRLIYANPHWQTITGLTADESQGDGWQCALDPLDAPVLLEDWKRARREGEEFSREFRLVTTRGEKRWARFRSRGLDAGNNGVAGHICTVADITVRKHAELELRASEEKYRALIEATGTGFAILDTRGNVLDANDEFVRQTGYQHLQEITGRSVTEWTAEHQKQSNAEEIRRCLEQGHVRALEVDYVDRAGKVTPVEINATMIETKHGPRVMALCRDITVRKQAAAVLQAKEDRLRLALEAGGLGAFEYNVLDVRILVSPKFCQILGLPLQASISRGEFVERVHPEDRTGVLASAQRMLSERTAIDIEYRLRLPDEPLRWIRAMASPVVKQGKVERVHGVVQDITPRKQAEFEVRMLSRAIEQSPISVVITDVQGRIEFVNPKFSAVTGYSFEDVRGKNPRVLKSGEMPPETYRHMWTELSAGKSWQGEFHNRKKNGELYWELASISPIRDDTGNVTHFVAVKEDITERKQADLALRESQECYRALFDRSQDCVYVHDFEGRFLDFNPAALALLGYERAELAAMTFGSLFISSDVPRALRVIEEIKAAGTQSSTVDFTLRRKDGTYVEVETKGSLVMRDGQPHSIQGIARNITERKRTDQTLKEQLALRERLAKIAATAPGVIYTFRLRPDGWTSVPYASPQSEEFYGVRADEVAEDAAPIFRLMHPEDRPHVQAAIAESARTMLPWRIEFRVNHPRKGLLWVEGQSNPEREADGSILWHGFMSDITERKRAEASLRKAESLVHQSQARYRSLIHSARDAIFTIALDGTFTSLNPAVEAIAGLSRAAWIGQPFAPMVHPDDLPLAVEMFHRVLKGEQTPVHELRGHPSLMVSAVMEMTLTAQKDENGKIIGLLGIGRDVAERKLAAQKLIELKLSEEQSRRKLEEAHLLNQSHFVTMVSHEFRTPLGVINTAAHVLGRYSDRMSEGERSAQLTEIQSAVVRMTQMMEDLLLYGKIETGKMKCRPSRVEMEKLCRQLISDLANLPGRHSSIGCVVAPEARDVFLDERILRHIIGNLLSNAVKYSVEGQPVRLEVNRLAGDFKEAEDTTSPREDLIHIKVIDSGIGIPVADLARLFESFHRAANVGDRPGSGLGMAIVKQCVDLHRGTISVESREGAGTTVSVRLPVPAREAPQEARSLLAHEAGGSGDSQGHMITRISEPLRS